jgi:hypothetical protein
MKNTPKVGLVSNFWGAVHEAAFLWLEPRLGCLDQGIECTAGAHGFLQQFF